MNERFPWYELVSGDSLEQGDLLIQCPVISPLPDLTYPLDRGPAEVLTYDLVILTQSCDLVNDKVQDVILSPHWDLTDAAYIDPLFARKDFVKDVINGRRFRYAMLNSCEADECQIGVRVVDFSRVFSLPESFVQAFVSQRGPRLRLLPPYREHLSQAFARFFMRVGLPQDIEVPR